ncbi:mevalonate kinase-like [Nylanderia fulva]|uniref:mevalonate kinase-like n=1 Tax=Nylanderia fulva TaxID=613905 RepID=UPI0010FB5F8F|nr:mevalonate kinase-like [Nylanderia fulva]
MIAIQQNLNITPFHVRVSTEIPIGAGLGGSTSFAVCLAACFLYWKNLQSENPIEFDHDLLLECVKIYAKFYEELQDNECASVDTSVCIFGNIIKGQLINHTENLECNYITRMKILLIDSNIRQEKWTRAKQMSTLKAETPLELEPILNTLDNVTIQMYDWLHLINNRREDPNLVNYYRRNNSVQRSFQLIHLLLKQYNLSNEIFNRICETANNFGFEGLIGFGTRYVYILIPPSITNDEIEEISMVLKFKNFDVINTSISCEGMKLDE